MRLVVKSAIARNRSDLNSMDLVMIHYSHEYSENSNDTDDRTTVLNLFTINGMKELTPPCHCIFKMTEPISSDRGFPKHLPDRDKR